MTRRDTDANFSVCAIMRNSAAVQENEPEDLSRSARANRRSRSKEMPRGRRNLVTNRVKTFIDTLHRGKDIIRAQ